MKSRLAIMKSELAIMKLYNNVHVRGRERIFFLYRKKRVIEVEGFHLNYTLFPSNKIYKENKQHK